MDIKIKSSTEMYRNLGFSIWVSNGVAPFDRFYVPCYIQGTHHIYCFISC